MKLVTLDCERCGAPLEAWHRRKQMKCTFCGAISVIQKPQPTAATGPSPESQELGRLDRQWRRRRSDLVSRDKAGRTHIPTNSEAVIIGIIGAVMSTFLFASGEFTAFAIFVAIGTVIAAVVQFTRAQSYESERRAYLKRRRRIMREIREARQG